MTGVNALIASWRAPTCSRASCAGPCHPHPRCSSAWPSGAVRQAGVAVRATFDQLREGLVVHPGPPQHLLGARLPDHHLVAHRGPGRARAELRQERPRARVRATSGCSCCRWASASWSASCSLNLFGKYVPRKRLIEIGLVVLGRVAAHPGCARRASGLPSDGADLAAQRDASWSRSRRASRTRSWRCRPRPRSRRSCRRTSGAASSASSTRSSAWPASCPSSSWARSRTSSGPTGVIILAPAVVGAHRARLVLLLARRWTPPPVPPRRTSPPTR